MEKEWNKFEECVKMIFLGPLKSSSLSEQSAYIKIWISEKGRNILSLSNLSVEDIECSNIIMNELRKFCNSSLYARYKFQERNQREDESVSNFVKILL